MIDFLAIALGLVAPCGALLAKRAFIRPANPRRTRSLLDTRRPLERLLDRRRPAPEALS